MTSALLAIHLIIFVAILYVLYKTEKKFPRLAIGALLFKFAMGLLLGVIYKYYYTIGDTFNYFYDGVSIATIAEQDVPGYLRFLTSSDKMGVILTMTEPRALFLSKIVSVFCLLTGNNYWLISLYFSLFSFLSCWYFIKAIDHHMPKLLYPSVLSFLLLPTFVFWSSGIIKESIAVGSLIFMAGLFVHAWFRNSPGIVPLLLAIPAFWFCWSLKYYFAAVFLVTVSAGLVLKILQRPLMKNAWPTQMAVSLSVLAIPLLVVSFVHPNFYYEKIWSVISDNYTQFHQLSDKGDAIVFWRMADASPQILLNAPWALISGLFRPFIWEAHGALQIYASIENSILLAATVFSAYHFKKSQIKVEPILLIIVVTFVIWLCIFLTLSTPNFGTLSRYRVAFLPFYALVIFSTEPARNFLERSMARLVR